MELLELGVLGVGLIEPLEYITLPEGVSTGDERNLGELCAEPKPAPFGFRDGA